ncbi:hypothetical protein [Roseivirga echinicomitans]|nr:hypothetical protein [Roseivirga echinicomitans]
MKKLIIITFLITSISGCKSSNLKKMFDELENMKSPDYSQIDELQLSESKAQIENTLMELYDADTTVMTATGLFKYGVDSTVLTSQWFKITFLNSKKITDIKNKALTDSLAIQIGNYLKPRVLNLKSYDRMDVIFINEASTSIEGATGSIKQTIQLSIPELDLIY